MLYVEANPTSFFVLTTKQQINQQAKTLHIPQHHHIVFHSRYTLQFNQKQQRVFLGKQAIPVR